MRRAFTMLSTIVVLSAFACAHQTTTSSPAAPASPDEAAMRSTVASGTTFNARLDGSFSSDRASVGDRVGAWLDEPLVAGDGAVLAPRGAHLVGHVIEVSRGAVGRVAVQFDGIEIGGRVHPMYAQLIRVESARVVVTHPTDPDSLQADVYPMTPEVSAFGPGAMGGGPAAAQVPLEIARDARIRLVLTRPFTLGATSTKSTQDTGEIDRTFE